MRIIAGQFKGRALTPVGKGDASAHLRPTTDRVRESLFNILSSGQFSLNWPDLVVADVFCGTGALGLEALSRGAVQAVFIDNGKTALGLVRRNIALLGVQERAQVASHDMRRLKTWPHKAVNVIFLDPPYGKGLGAVALNNLAQAGAIAPEALIIHEDNAPATSIEGLEPLETRRFGSTTMSFLSAL